MIANQTVGDPERPSQAVLDEPVESLAFATPGRKQDVELCGCGAPAQYRVGRYAICDDCSWLLAEQGGAP